MSVHRNSAFKNACIKMPIHPGSRRPVPRFERPTIIVQPCESVSALGRQSQQSSSERSPRKPKTTYEKNVTNLVDFIESIPGYKFYVFITLARILI